jgi:hypothetical protein
VKVAEIEEVGRREMNWEEAIFFLFSMIVAVQKNSKNH